MGDGDLERYAARFPSMGGTLNGPLLRSLAAGAPSDTSIVEVGTWLGAGTAQLALGLQGRADPPTIHCFDMFQASAPEVAQAGEFGVTLEPGQDTSGHVREALAPFGVPVVIHKGDFTKAAWNGGPVSVFVDDGTKWAGPFHRALTAFGPHWIPGVTVIALMDYLYWQRLPPRKARPLMAQQIFMEGHAANFEPVTADYPEGSTTRLFRYREALDFGRLEPVDTRGRLSRSLPAWIREPARRLLGREHAGPQAGPAPEGGGASLAGAPPEPVGKPSI
jgi:hypothetical protein